MAVDGRALRYHGAGIDFVWREASIIAACSVEELVLGGGCNNFQSLSSICYLVSGIWHLVSGI